MTRDEAIEVIRKNMPSDKSLPVYEALHSLIPELTESDDERIRKLLVWQVYRNIEDETNDLAQSVYDGIKGHDPDLEESIEDWKKCLAYLEKQKEQKVDIDKLRRDIYQSGYNDGYQHGKEDAQKEQKPVDEPEKDNRYWFGFNEGKGAVLDNPEEYGLCKPAEWSDEDEEMRLEAIRVLVSGCERYRKESGCLPSWHKVIDWLKSLRPQPKRDCKDCAMFLNGECTKPHWKPSEEQIHAIIEALKYLPNNKDEWMVLNTLVDVFKKLI